MIAADSAKADSAKKTLDRMRLASKPIGRTKYCSRKPTEQVA